MFDCSNYLSVHMARDAAFSFFRFSQQCDPLAAWASARSVEGLQPLSCVGSPKDFLWLVVREALPIERTRSFPVQTQLLETRVAEHVPARQKHFDVVASICAAAARHFRLPQLVLHRSDFQVHARHQAHLATCLLPTLQLLPQHVCILLGLRQMLLHLCIRVLSHMQSRAGLGLCLLCDRKLFLEAL